MSLAQFQLPSDFDVLSRRVALARMRRFEPSHVRRLAIIFHIVAAIAVSITVGTSFWAAGDSLPALPPLDGVTDTATLFRTQWLFVGGEMILLGLHVLALVAWLLLDAEKMAIGTLGAVGVVVVLRWGVSWYLAPLPVLWPIVASTMLYAPILICLWSYSGATIAGGYLWSTCAGILPVLGYLRADDIAPLSDIRLIAGVICAWALLLLYYELWQADLQERVAIAMERDTLKIEVGLDPLTKLLNRRGARPMLEEALLPPGTLTLALIDIDHFKRINDQLGHTRGDIVLEQVAAMLAAMIPTGDWFAARWGGEEFLVAMPSEDREVGRRWADAFRSAVADSDSFGVPVTLSAGVASSTELDGSADLLLSYADLLNLADRRLYRAKSEGRNRVY